MIQVVTYATHSQGMFDELLKQVTRLPKPVAGAYFRIITCLEQLDRIDEAKAYIEDILQLNAPEEFKQQAREELARLDLTQKVKAGKGNVKMSEIHKSLAKALPKKIPAQEDGEKSS